MRERAQSVSDKLTHQKNGRKETNCNLRGLQSNDTPDFVLHIIWPVLLLVVRRRRELAINRRVSQSFITRLSLDRFVACL